MDVLVKDEVDVEIVGEVISSETRRLSKRGESYQTTIPKDWRRFFDTPVVELTLVRRENRPWWDRYVIVLTKPKGGEKRSG